MAKEARKHNCVCTHTTCLIILDDLLNKELGGLRGRLNNPKFVESAPEEVIIEARENLALRQEEEAQLKAAIARLAELG